MPGPTPAPADAPAHWLVGTVLLDGIAGHCQGGSHFNYSVFRQGTVKP